MRRWQNWRASTWCSIRSIPRPARNFNVDLKHATPEQAFDYLAMLTHTFWKPISPNTIFVAEDNVTKRRDYEDEVVKVFYVTNATSVQEFQEIATAIRTVAEIRRVFYVQCAEGHDRARYRWTQSRWPKSWCTIWTNRSRK